MAWLRQLRLVFGASTAANAAVLAIFMGGLGLGGLLLGRRVDRHPQPLRVYGLLELGVALSAGLSPLLVAGVRSAYVHLGGTPVLGDGGGTVVRLLLSAVVLGVPTFLMGGTLPAVVRAVERAHDASRRRLGLLYALNTLGSVGGTLVATFVAIEALGIQATLWSAVAVNLVVAGVALWQAPRWPAEPAAASAAAAGPSDRPPKALVLAGAAGSGLCFLLMELCWYRVLAPLLGGSSYSFGMILAVALLGIGFGGLAYSAWARRNTPTVLAFGATAVLEALLVGLPLALGDDFAVWAARLRPLGEAGFGPLVSVWFAVAAAAILPGALVAGFQFPLLVGLMGKGAEGVGRQVGQAYAANTLGSIVGSLAGGFGLLPLLGAVGAWRLVLGLLAALAAAAAWSGRARRTPALAVMLGVAGVVGIATAPGPTAGWRHSPIGAGRSALSTLDGLALADQLQETRRATVWEVDGVESALALQSLTGFAFAIHGKVDGHVLGDAPTNLWLGLLPTLLHPNPERVLVVGLGTGQTAGWAADVPAVKQVDVVELEPAVVEVARACAPSNRGVLDNPKVAVRFGDAREWLLTTPEAYDVLISEPSNPYRAGIASLFSVEFYAAVEERLAEDGLFLQWIQAYELSPETLATALATLGAVFPSIEIWEGASNGDLLVVASRRPVAHDPARLARAVAQTPFREGLAQGWRVAGLPGLYAGYVGGQGLADALAAGAPVNTDDHPVIEFGFARHVGQGDGVTVNGLRAQAAAGGWDRPPVDVPGLARLEARHVKAAAGADLPGVPAGLAPDLTARMAARMAWAEDDLAGALARWQQQETPPQQPLDLLVLAEALAEAGDPGALPLAARLDAASAAEADLVRARLAARLRDADVAVAHLTAGLTAARTDPWVHPRTLSRALNLAKELGAARPAHAEALLQPVLEPFAVGNLDEHRRAAALRLAQQAGFERWCAPAFATMEPWPPLHPVLQQQRVACYAAAGHPLLPAAEADLATVRALSPP